MTKKNRIFKSILLCLTIFMIVGIASDSHSREMSEYPRVKLQSLDKVTAHTMTFEANIGDTLKFGPLYMKVQSCQKSSPIDEPESAAFIQVWEVDKDEEANWVFSGWMFASSPSLSPMDHPIYDVWVLDCLAADNDKSNDTPLENEETKGEGNSSPSFEGNKDKEE